MKLLHFCFQVVISFEEICWTTWCQLKHKQRTSKDCLYFHANSPAGCLQRIIKNFSSTKTWQNFELWITWSMKILMKAESMRFAQILFLQSRIPWEICTSYGSGTQWIAQVHSHELCRLRNWSSVYWWNTVDSTPLALSCLTMCPGGRGLN